jgi:hypothetical protein
MENDGEDELSRTILTVPVRGTAHNKDWMVIPEFVVATAAASFPEPAAAVNAATAVNAPASCVIMWVAAERSAI